MVENVFICVFSSTSMQYSILITILIGSVASQMMPYFRKLSEGTVESFDFKYAYNLAIAALWQSLIALPVYTTWSAPEGIADVFIIHVMALLFGFGGYKLQLEGMKYYKLLSSANEGFPKVEEVEIPAPVAEPRPTEPAKKVVKKKVVKKKAAKKPAKKPAKKSEE